MVWNMKISVLHSRMESLPIMNAAIMIQKNRTKNIFLKSVYSNTKHFLWENLLSEPTRPLMPWDSSLAFPICCRSSLKKRPDHILQLVILASLTKRNYALTTRTERKWSPKKTTIPYCVTPTADHAYFGCHTDITIPYHELGDIIVNGRDGRKIPIIKEGRFVLPGTEALNEPLR